MVEATTRPISNAASAGRSGSLQLPSPQNYKPAPAEIEYGKLKFLITDRPTDFTIQQFIEELRRHNANDVVRVCEPTYATDPLANVGIEVYDWEFSDGSFPPKDIVDKWLRLLQDRFRQKPGSCIAVHCVAGLGRAPVLVALALMEAGVKYEESVEIIRQHRRGAINQRQLAALQKYKPTGVLKALKNGKRDNKECVLM